MVRDYERGAQWCRQVAEFSQRMDTRFVTGVCRAHYAAILTWHGKWQEAEQDLLAAVRHLTANRPMWLPEAVVRLGDLRRRQGRLDEAERLFTEASEHPLRWGDPDHVRGLFEGTGTDLTFEREVADIHHDSVDSAVTCHTTMFGPVVQARVMAEADDRWPNLRDDLAGMFARHNRSGGTGVVVPSEYLVALGRRSG